MNENTTFEQEIDLKGLIITVLRKWRIILLAAILLGTALGGYKFVNGIRRQMNADTVAKAQQEYEDALQIYENTKATYEREIQNITDSIERETLYSEDSVLMNISPYDKYEATVDVFVKTAYEIMPGMVYQNVDYSNSIISSYAVLVRQGNILKKIAKNMNMELHYIEELVTVTEDFNNKMLHIKVVYSDRVTADKILSQILNDIEASSAEFIQSMGEHTLSILNKNVGSVVDLTLIDLQKNNTDNVTSLQSALITKKAELKNLVEPTITLSKRTTLKSGIKYAVLGGVLGALIMIFFVCAAFFINDKILSGKDLRNRFGIKILGQLPGQQKKRVFAVVDQWIDKLEGIDRTIEETAICQVIAANVKNYTQAEKKILLTGCVTIDVISQIAELLKDELQGYELLISGNMNTDAATLQKLPECDGIILVEQKETSSINMIADEIETIKNLSKNLIGCILCEKTL